jgi:soluble lytic murein transglycosylase-like protein
MRLVSVMCMLVPMAIGIQRAAADVYSFVDKDGVVHITNMKPRSDKWRKVLVEGPDTGKAAATRGSCDRCDLVPARDNSKERFSRYDTFIHEAAALYQIPVPLIRAVIKTESDYDPRVVSAMGARGLMQLMPEIVTEMGVTNVHDPRENILGGTRLLRVLANRYQGDLVRTIAAYHAGPGSLAKYGNEVPPYRRTRKYLQTVLDRYYQYRTRSVGTW